MKIAIVSGKGGVGKSSILASLAIVLKEKKQIVLVDADADCPNQHLLFKGKEILSKPLYASHLAEIDYSKCTKCGACKSVCKFGALEFEDRPAIDSLSCEGCGACAVVCPQNAIAIKEVESGIARVVDTEAGFKLVYGKLHPGRSGSGKIVHAVRELASGYPSDLTLIDSAAGIGCPVIASITGTDYAIGIVEPTPSSISDLERMLKTASHFKIPYWIILNKAGLSGENEDKIRKKWQGKIIAEVPYNSEVPRLLALGKPVLYANPEIKAEIEALSEKILEKNEIKP